MKTNTACMGALRDQVRPKYKSQIRSKSQIHMKLKHTD